MADKVTERVEFKLIRTPCCGHLLCWVNPRYPTFCPECGSRMKQEDIRANVMFADYEANLIYERQGDF